MHADCDTKPKNIKDREKKQYSLKYFGRNDFLD